MATPHATVDLRKVTHAQVAERLRVLEAQGHKVRTVRHSDQTLDVFLEDRHPDTLPGFLQFGKTVQQAVGDVNRMGITGATLLGDQFRNQLAEVKTQLAQAGTEMTAAMSELKDTANQAVGMVKAVKAETADLKAALSLNSNNPPA